MTIAMLALALSVLLFAGAIVLLVLLRRGEGPRYSANRAYDESRRQALRLLLGEAAPARIEGQWFLAGRDSPMANDPLEGGFREAALEALRVVVPADRGLAVGADGVRLAGATIVPAVSTADLRAPRKLEAGKDGLVVGLVLFNAEPPGGDAHRVTIPIQALFPALEHAGRHDLVDRFTALRGQAVPQPSTAEVR